MTQYLTKSHYNKGLQCLKLLWYSIHDKAAFPPVEYTTQAKFDTGHLIGSYAMKYFPRGVHVSEFPMQQNISETRQLLLNRLPLYEPGLDAHDCYARVDILNPIGDSEWDIVEVKSSTKVKDQYIHDISFQRFVFEKAGVKIRNCYLMLVDNQYVRQGEIDPKQLLKLEDVTLLVDEASEGIEQRIADMLAVMSAGECPDIAIGPHCTSPYDCDLMRALCWKDIPEQGSVFDLFNARGKQWELYNQGILSLKDIPEDFDLSDKQQVQRMTAIHEKPFVNHDKIQEFLSQLEYPVHYLDFESMNPAVPLYDGTRPYQQIPFQFSLHIQEQDGSIEHHEFLHDSQTDPRPEFIRKLKQTIQPQGSIVAFFQSFEKTRIKECAEQDPNPEQYDQWHKDLLPRFIDLQTPFKQYHYYDPNQHGSNSIKAVLPALTGTSYEELDIGDGMTAGLKYQDMIFSDLKADEKEKIRVDLLKYCGLDTEGMVWILDKLKEIQ